MGGMTSRKMKALARAGKGPHSPEARAKALKSMKTTLARRRALLAEVESRGTDIPLDAIPERATPRKVKPSPAAFDPTETVQIIAGNFRITVERSKP